MLELLTHSFALHAGKDERIDAADLQHAMRVRGDFLAQRMLALLDRNGDGCIDRAEFLEAVRRLVFGSPAQKLRLAFQIHDLDGNGRIEAEELKRLIAMNLWEEAGGGPSGVHSARRRDDRVNELSSLLVSTADENSDHSLSFEEFERITRADPALFQLITESEASWLAPQARLLEAQIRSAEWAPRVRRYIGNHLPLIVCCSLWLGANVFLFVNALIQYRSAGPWVMLARGLGACLNLNGALVLVPVTRRLLTWVRNSALGRFLPLDDALSIHRFLGQCLFFMGLAHTGAHLVNYSKGMGIATGLLHTPAGRTGLGLLLVSAVMWGFSLPQLRKSGRFELFYFAHFGYVFWFLLALAHGPRFWKFALIPVLAFAFEWLARARRRTQNARFVKLTGLASGVSRLEVERPPAFQHKAGDYAFVKIPALARHEWHPFTISSAPGLGSLTFHIRSEGDWTGSLRRLADDPRLLDPYFDLKVHIDGPFGSPSMHVFESRYAVLVGAGIGVTPFASVLEDLLIRAHAGEIQLEKLYFFWLNRDSRAFAWFADLLLYLEQMDKKQLVDVRVCLTGGRGNTGALALNLARNLAHDIGKPDFVTGLSTQTRLGAPDFEKELAEIAERHAPAPVDVFFCGPPSLGSKLAGICRRLALRFREERF
ncbi:MAG TPA: EF-hand domain-containing protein [Polyangiaceae bacterium]|nr:EF-hand domain-containing protein [Polyangiaceae bacterium]